MVNLSSVAGKTITDIRLDADGTTQAGQWDIYYQDMVFIGADGTVRPVFSQNPVAPGMSGTGSTGMTQTSVTIHDCAGTGCAPINTTTYFHGDQIGSARLLSEGYGYPVWQGTFTPFGQEASPELTTNHYKFNGKERGEAAEGGLDYFGARYYSSTLGRWMTADWSEEPAAVPYANYTNPQSLNLYGYVTDDPLSQTDLDGHQQFTPGNDSNGYESGGQSCGFWCHMKNALIGEFMCWCTDQQEDQRKVAWLEHHFSGGYADDGEVIPFKKLSHEALKDAYDAGLNIWWQTESRRIDPFNIKQGLTFSPGVMRMILMSRTSDATLKNLINDLYKSGSTFGDGGTADAVEYERATGRPIGGTYHSQKAEEYSRALGKAINSGRLSDADKAIAQHLLDRLQQALTRQ